MEPIKSPASNRILFTLSVAGFALLHIAIELLEGGVRVHYPLMREDLPAISNWWGLIVLPSLACLLYSFMQQGGQDSGPMGLSWVALYRLLAGFVYGGLLAGTFEFGLGQTPLYLLMCLIVGGIAYPIYRAELVLGFIMGMTYTFGAVIPTAVASLVALSSLLLHSTARFAIGKLST